MDERLKFIARLLDGEKMAGLCREFGISRKTGYKILARYNEIGLEGLTDRSRRAYRHANQLPFQIETQIVHLKQDKPSWGAPKIREKLARLYPDVHTPAISTVHAVLDRHGLVERRRGGVTEPRERHFLFPASPTTCGAPTTRASSCSPIGATAIRSPSPTSQSISVRLRSALHHQGSLCVPGVRGRFQGVRPSQSHPHRQRRSLRKPPCALRPQQALGVVAAARHRDRAHQARPSAAERPP